MKIIKTQHFELVYTHKLSDLPNFDPNLPVFCDIETYGLYIQDATRLVQYYQPQTDPRVWVLDVEYFGKVLIPMYKAMGKSTEDIVTPKKLAEFHKPLWLVFWNGTFDQSTLSSKANKTPTQLRNHHLVLSDRVDDLWYMAKVALPKLGKFNLDIVVDYLLGKHHYRDLVKKDLQKKGFKPGTLTDEQLIYSATDVYVMAELWDILYDKVKNNLAYKISIKNQWYSVRWQQTGLKVNLGKLMQEEKKLLKELEEVSKKLPESLNVNSPKQVTAFLDTPKSDEDTLLHKAAEGCPYSKNILEKRSILKTLKFIDTYRVDRVYSFYNPMGTRTGRWSAKSAKVRGTGNLQQLPRKLKHIFGYTDDEPYVMVGADLPTAELRLAAAIYVDDMMADAFMKDIDLHYLTASRLTGKPVEEITKEERKTAKAFSFGLLYGMRAASFQKYAFSNYGVILTLEEAEEGRDKWLNTYVGIKETIDKVTKQFYKKKDMIVYTPMGLPVKPELYTDALNIPIQGAVSEISKLWIHYMWQEHNKGISDIHKEALPIINMVHDAVYLESLEEDADYWAELLGWSQKKAWTEYCKLPMIKIKDIPMNAEVKISKSYAKAD